MGYLKKEFIIIELFIEKEVEQVKKLISKIKPKYYQKLFLMVEHICNGGYSLFISWDGSKEGWDTSNEFDEIRNNFIEDIKKLKYIIIWYVCDDEHLEVPYVKRIDED